MTSKSTQAKEGLSFRWLFAAAVGLIMALSVLMGAGIWASAAVLFVVCFVLALGKPFKRYRKFVYRGVLPAGGIILIATWFLGTIVLPDVVADPIVRLFLSFAISVPFGLIPVFVLIELYGRVRLHWVTTIIPEIEEKDALALLRSLFLGLNYPTMVVGDNEVKTTRQSGPSGPGGILQKIGGPGLIFVNHGYAVVLERAGRFTRVARAGSTLLENWERPRAFVTLSPQRKSWKVDDAYTKDGVQLSFELEMLCQIRCAEPANRPGPGGEFQRSRSTIRIPDAARPAASSTDDKETFGKADLVELASAAQSSAMTYKDCFPVTDEDVLEAVYNVNNWEDALQALASHVLRDIIAEQNLDTIFHVDATQHQLLTRPRIRGEVMRRVNETSRRDWGCESTWLNVGAVSIPAPVQEQLLRRWVAERAKHVQITQADGDKEAMIRRGEGEAAVLARVERVKAEARSEIIKKLREAVYGDQREISPEMAQRLIEVAENLSKELVTEDITKLRQMDVYERLVSSSGDKTIVLGSGTPFFTPGATHE